MTTLYLIRHPKVAVAPGVCYGRSDVSLAGPVDTLAAQLRTQLPEHFTLLSSPAKRCLTLARALGSPLVDPRLQEIDFGAWEMRPYDAIERELIDTWASDPLHFRAHGGESVAQMQARCILALEAALQSAPTHLVIVSHAGPLRALAGHLRNLAEDAWMQLNFDYGSLTRISVG